MALIESKWKKIRDMIPLQYVCMCTSNSLVRALEIWLIAQMLTQWHLFAQSGDF